MNLLCKAHGSNTFEFVIEKCSHRTTVAVTQLLTPHIFVFVVSLWKTQGRGSFL